MVQVFKVRMQDGAAARTDGVNIWLDDRLNEEEARANCHAEARLILEAAAPHLTAGMEWGVFRASDGEPGEPIENRRYNSREAAQRMIDQGYNPSNIWEVRGRKVGEWAK